MLETVYGQPEAVAYLRRVAEGTLKLPLLLSGPSGVGRRFSVAETAKQVFGVEQQLALSGGHHPDYRVVEVEDDKDIKVEAVRDLIDETRSLPSWAPVKFFVIDGVDRLTIAAANALLKVLEERPQKARFFLLAEQSEAVIPTIRSRCAVVRYRRLPERFVLEKLLEITEDEMKAQVCARVGEGSLGRATRCFVAGQLAVRDEARAVLEHASRKDLFAVFSAVDEVADLPLALTFMGQLLHDVLVVRVAPGRVVHLDTLDALGTLSSVLTSEHV